MNRTLLAALGAATLLSAAPLSGAALAQGLQPSGTRAGGPGQAGAPGELTMQNRTYLRGYVTRVPGSPVTMQERVVPGWTVPGTVELQTFPDTVYTDVPTARGYRYFSTGNTVVLVDPSSRRVVEVID